MPDDTTLVSLADVARLAGVTRPAVSNWRRRHKDFPVPVRETDAAALFTLADIRAWLTAHGKELVRPSLRDEIAAALNTVRADIGVGTVVELCLQVLASYVTEGRREPAPTVAGAAPVVSLLPRLVDAHGEVAVCEALIAEATAREQRVYWRATPPGVADLVLAFAGDLSGAVHDPHCGIGTLLLAVAGSGSAVRLTGDCEDKTEHRIATLRLMIHGVDVDVRRAEDPPGPVADVVLTASDTSWTESAELLDRTVRALRPGGRGLHVSPHSLLVHRKDQARRKHVVRQGVVEAVIELPHDLYGGGFEHTALWLLRPPGEATVPDVLLVDARRATGTDGRLDQRDLDDLVRACRSWQETGELPDRFPATAVPRESLLDGECWLDVASWRDDVDLPEALTRYDGARVRLGRTATTLATAVPRELVASTAPRRPVHELIAAGEVELIRGVRSDGERTEEITNRRGDVLISVGRGRVDAHAVTRGGALVLLPDHCLRLRKPSMARARTIAAQLSAGQDALRYADVRDLLLRWPSDEECERVVAVLDHLAEVRREAAEVAKAAEALTTRTFEALAAGAAPIIDPRAVDG